MDDIQIERFSAPLPAAVRDALTRLWLDHFGPEEVAATAAQLAGQETAANDDIVFCARDAGGWCGSCHLTFHRPTGLGGLGGVAVAPERRGRHIGERVCEAALAAFDAVNGRNLFLGTVNPAAARLYQKLGFHYLAGSTVMVRPGPGNGIPSRNGEHFEVAPGDASSRIPMIPAILNAHALMLDVNAGLAGSAYFTQNSCMGLYPRYQAIRAAGGDWFRAASDAGELLGLGSFRPENGQAVVDFFTLPEYWYTAGPELVRRLLAAVPAGMPVTSRVAAMDRDKCRVLDAFAVTPAVDREFNFGGFARIPGVQLQLRNS